MTYSTRTLEIDLDFDIELISIGDLHKLLSCKNPAVTKYAEQILDNQAKIKKLSFTVNHIKDELNYLKASHKTWQACIEAIRETQVGANRITENEKNA